MTPKLPQFWQNYRHLKCHICITWIGTTIKKLSTYMIQFWMGRFIFGKLGRIGRNNMNGHTYLPRRIHLRSALKLPLRCQFEYNIEISAFNMTLSITTPRAQLEWLRKNIAKSKNVHFFNISSRVESPQIHISKLLSFFPWNGKASIL